MKREAKQPLVSVLVPAYNAEKFINEALVSVQKQTYKNLEIIVCDDASTDETGSIIKSIAVGDKRIRYVRNRKNLYIAGNRNKLLSLAKGEYIIWADADDISMPYRVESQLSEFMKNPRLGICGGYLEVFNDTNKNTSIREYPAGDKEARSKLFRYVTVAQPAAMIKRSVLDGVGVYDLATPPAEDLDMLFRIALVAELGNVNKPVIRYRDNPGSATYKRLKAMELTSLKIRFKYLKDPRFKHSISDYVFNILHWLSVWFIPAKLKIRLFNKWRNTSNG